MAAGNGITLMRVTVEDGAGWKAGNPTKVLDLYQYVVPPSPRAYDISPDGKRFLMIKPLGTESAARQANLARPAEEGVIVVENWTQELKRLAPSK